MPIVGRYKHQIDEKGRFRVPAKIRPDLGESFYIICGPLGSLLLVPQQETDKIFLKLNDVSLASEETQSALLMLASNTEKAEEDSQGRIVLTKEQLAFANIKKNLVTVGGVNRAELWAEEVWQEFVAKNNDVRKQFGELGKRGV